MLQKKPSPSIHEIAEEKEEIMDQVTINTLNEKVDLELTLQHTKRMQRIREPQKT